MKINVVSKVLKANSLVAEGNRSVFKEAGVLAVNLISSPGSGKTTLLEKTIEELKPQHKSAVVVGDLQTTRDAERLAPMSTHVTQINTGMSCHLYANQIAESHPKLNLQEVSFLFIENVGNMVCPGEFDLGENVKVVLLSIPEGDDKVAKYPTIFRAADIVLLTKTDLLGILPFDKERVREDLSKLNANVRLLELSVWTKQGLSEWIDWLCYQREKSIGAQAKFITE